MCVCVFLTTADDSCMGVDCHLNASCDSIRGCLCKDGFQGDGVSCEGKQSIQCTCDLKVPHQMTKCLRETGMRLRIGTAVI